jgi:hypothetical protein
VFPGPLSVPLGPCRIYRKFAEIFANECLSAVSTTTAIVSFERHEKTRPIHTRIRDPWGRQNYFKPKRRYFRPPKSDPSMQYPNSNRFFVRWNLTFCWKDKFYRCRLGCSLTMVFVFVYIWLKWRPVRLYSAWAVDFTRWKCTFLNYCSNKLVKSRLSRKSTFQPPFRYFSTFPPQV